MATTTGSRSLVIRPTRAQLARVWALVYELTEGYSRKEILFASGLGGAPIDAARLRYREGLARIFAKAIGRRGVPDGCDIVILDADPPKLGELPPPYLRRRKTRTEVRLTWAD